MNKITRKPRGIQTRWIEVKGWDFIARPIKTRKYFKYITAQNKRFKAQCFKWYDEYENEYLYALWVFELVGNEYKERLHAGRCLKRLTKKDLKRQCRNMPKLLELLNSKNIEGGTKEND